MPIELGRRPNLGARRLGRLSACGAWKRGGVIAQTRQPQQENPPVQICYYRGFTMPDTAVFRPEPFDFLMNTTQNSGVDCFTFTKERGS